jgi:hypothetical protein
MPVAKQVQTQNFGFLSLSKKMFLYGTLVGFLVMLIGAATMGISAIAGSLLGAGIGGGIIFFGKLWLACDFALYSITSKEDSIYRAGLMVGAGFITAALI